MNGSPTEPTSADGPTFFVGATNVAARHVLGSVLERVGWLAATASAGDMVRLEVIARHVGDGAPVSVEVADISGSHVYRNEGFMSAGRFYFDVPIPPDLPRSSSAIVAWVRLPRHGLEHSALLSIASPVVVERLEWSRASAVHGERVRLSARVQDAKAVAASVQVYRAGPDGVDEQVGPPFALALDQGRLETEWSVPDSAVLEPRGEGPALFFRVTDGDARESAPSPLLRVTGARP